MADTNAIRRPNEVLIDRTSVGYAAVGLLLGLQNLTAMQAAGVMVAFKLLRGPLQKMGFGMFPPMSRDGLATEALDVAAGMAGWAAIKALPPQR